MNQNEPQVTIRQTTAEDVPGILECQRAAYPDFEPADLLMEEHFLSHLDVFPEGQIVAIVDGKVAGYSSSLIVRLDDDSPWHSYNDITDSGTFQSHNLLGDTLYGAEMTVHPDFQGMGVSGLLYETRKELLQKHNLRRMVAGGRLPGFREYAGKMTAEDYVQKVIDGEIDDQALNAHLSAGYTVKSVHFDFMGDRESLNYATLLEWENPEYKDIRRHGHAQPIRRPHRHVRVCAAQYEIRPIRSWEEFEQQVMFFVITAHSYNCHFLLFPELFTVQLFSIMDPSLDDLEAMRELSALYTEAYIALFRRLAKEYQIHIIAGSHPVVVEGELRNVAFLFTPKGEFFTQDKLHITPDERQNFGIQPGRGINVFDTGIARIAIQVCYDVEFPEVTRLLTMRGAEILFVPFSTDEKKAYQRVRICAHARAIEDWIYVVLAGNIGNLPQVTSFLINYGQAAVFTPSDFPFPANGIAAEADPNTETVVITDLNLNDLAVHREFGAVRPLRDRRVDLYDINERQHIPLIRTY